MSNFYENPQEFTYRPGKNMSQLYPVDDELEWPYPKEPIMKKEKQSKSTINNITPATNLTNITGSDNMQFESYSSHLEKQAHRNSYQTSFNESSSSLCSEESIYTNPFEQLQMSDREICHSRKPQRQIEKQASWPREPDESLEHFYEWESYSYHTNGKHHGTSSTIAQNEDFVGEKVIGMEEHRAWESIQKK